MLNFSSIVKSSLLGYRPFQVERSVTTFQNEGEPTTTLSIFPANGILTPATEKELMLLPEGKRSKNVIKILTVEPLRDTDQDTDTIIYQGKRYKVFKSKPWQDYGFFRSFAEELI